MKDRNGFTLIELLVVIAIIVILISMLVPGLERAMASAQKASCLANLDAVGTATEMYLLDFKRHYPNYTTPGSGRIWGPDGQSRPPHQVLIDHTLGSAKIFVCPGDPSPDNFHWWRYHYYKGNVPSFIRDDEVEDQVFVSDDGPPYDGLLSGASYMASEEFAYSEAENSGGVGVVASQVMRPDVWGYFADGNWAINAYSWQNVDPKDPFAPGARLDWSHLGTVTMLTGDKSAVSVTQYSADGKTQPIADRYKSDPYKPNPGRPPGSGEGWPSRYSEH